MKAGLGQNNYIIKAKKIVNLLPASSEFASLISALLNQPQLKRKRIILVIGAGMSQLSYILHPNKICEKTRVTACSNCPHNDSAEQEQKRSIWSEYEYNRMYSRNVLPEVAYYFVAKFCALGLVRSIITTNYDSFILSIFQRDQTLPRIVVNPVLPRGEQDPSGHRSAKSSWTKLSLYMIHGGFEWARFRDCHCMIALPNWAVGSNLWRLPDKWEAAWYHDYKKSSQHPSTGPAEHFIDWNVNRQPFAPEIDAARAEIKWAEKAGGLLLLLGFRGINCPRLPTWHEELSEPIAQAANTIPTFMVLTTAQANDNDVGTNKPDEPTRAERSWLHNQIDNSSLGLAEIKDSIGEWFYTSLQKTGIDPARVGKEYLNQWSLSQLFLTADQFKRGL